MERHGGSRRNVPTSATVAFLAAAAAAATAATPSTTTSPPISPPRPSDFFTNFRASRSGDWRFLCNTEMYYDGFWSSNNVKGMVGTFRGCKKGFC